MKKALLVFRRDLRLEDNSALNAALESFDEVVPVFVIDPLLIDRWQYAEKRLAFMFQSVAALEQAIAGQGGQLVIARGDPTVEIRRLAEDFGAGAVFVNREYSPVGRRRDEAVAAACQKSGIHFEAHDDLLLNPPAAVLKDDGDPYVVFTPYFRRAAMLAVPEPQSLVKGRFAAPCQSAALGEFSEIAHFLKLSLAAFTPGIAGSMEALERLDRLADYSQQRDVPASGQTSGLSAHLRFGTCSPRQFYHQVRHVLGADHPLLRQLYWRDFYYQVAWYFPRVYRQAFRKQYNAIDWQDDATNFRHWCEGTTGFPIVDAGMRELLANGYMHNRVRMIVASFLTKNLHISWQQGEKHFAEHLVDYDPAVNNGNWQWGASTGCDAQPYFRVFNPWRQQQKFDKDCAYIKRWVPELAAYPAKAIHGLESRGDFYLPQIADLRSSSEAIKLAFKKASSGN